MHGNHIGICFLDSFQQLVQFIDGGWVGVEAQFSSNVCTIPNSVVTSGGNFFALVFRITVSIRQQIVQAAIGVGERTLQTRLINIIEVCNVGAYIKCIENIVQQVILNVFGQGRGVGANHYDVGALRRVTSQASLNQGIVIAATGGSIPNDRAASAFLDLPELG